MTDTDEARPIGRKSLGELLADVPRLLVELVRAELDAFKAELASSARRMGIGLGLILAAAIVAFLAVVVLIIAAIAALALVLPTWAATLIVAGALLVIAGIAVWLGVVRLKTAGPDIEGRIESINDDLRAIRGEAPREQAGGSDG